MPRKCLEHWGWKPQLLDRDVFLNKEIEGHTKIIIIIYKKRGAYKKPKEEEKTGGREKPLPKVLLTIRLSI